MRCAQASFEFSTKPLHCALTTSVPWYPEGPLETSLGQGMFNFMLVIVQKGPNFFVSCHIVSGVVTIEALYEAEIPIVYIFQCADDFCTTQVMDNFRYYVP